MKELSRLKKAFALIEELEKTIKELSFQDKEYIISQPKTPNLLEGLGAAKLGVSDLICDHIFCPKCKGGYIKNTVLKSSLEVGKCDFEINTYHCTKCFNNWSEF